MAIELLTEIPSLLRPGYVVRFSASWEKEWASKWFRVLRTQQIKFDVPRIVDAAGTLDLDFSAPAGGGVGNTNISLLPESSKSIYEIVIGLKGLIAVYPRYNNSYFLKLEATGVLPDVTDANLRWLGFFDQDDSPFAQSRLREYTVKDQTPPVLRLYNQHGQTEKLVLRFICNRCRVEEVAESQLTEAERRLARHIEHFDLFTW